LGLLDRRLDYRHAVKLCALPRSSEVPPVHQFPTRSDEILGRTTPRSASEDSPRPLGQILQLALEPTVERFAIQFPALSLCHHLELAVDLRLNRALSEHTATDGMNAAEAS